MTTRHAIVFSLLAAMLGLAYSSTIAAPDKQATSPKVQALLEAKRDVLKDRVNMLDALWKNSRLDDYSRCISARNDLFAAELELATTKDARLALMKQRVANCEDLEKFHQQRLESARGTKTEVLAAQAARIDAEIALAREEGS